MSVSTEATVTLSYIYAGQRYWYSWFAAPKAPADHSQLLPCQMSLNTANCQIFIFLCVKNRLAMMHSSLFSHLRSQRSLTWSEHFLLGFSELRMCWTLIKFTKCQDATLGAGNIPEKVTWCDIRVMVGGDKIEIKIFDTFDSPGRPGYQSDGLRVIT